MTERTEDERFKEYVRFKVHIVDEYYRIREELSEQTGVPND